MALKHQLTKDEHAALPEVLREHYAESNGVFSLQADGLVTRASLDAEREARKQASQQFNELKDKLGDLDPVKAREAMRQLQAMADKKLLDEGMVEELIKSRTESMSADFNNRENGWKKKVDELTNSNTSLTKNLTDLTIRNDFTPVFLKRGGDADFLPFAINLVTRDGVDGVTWGMKDGKIVALQGDGSIKYGKDPNVPMTFDEAVEVMATKHGKLFLGNSGSGARNDGGKPGAAHTMSNVDAQDPAKYRAARDAAKAAGAELTIV